MENNQMLNSNAYVTKNGTYLSINDELDSSTLKAFINDNQSKLTQYRDNYRLYTGDHKILSWPKDPNSARPDNRLVSNWANYVVDTYIGYFMGKPPKISFDEQTANDQLQDWFNNNSFQDKLIEVAKQVALYGHSYLLGYQDEDSATKVAVVEPSEGFMVYDTTINHKPLAFVRYNYFNNQLSGEVYTAKNIQYFDNGCDITKTEDHLFGAVPAVEFYSNSERLSLVEKVKTLVEEYDSAFSRKANQVDYFDQAYLKILGIQLENDPNTGEPILDLGANKVLYSPDQDAANGQVDFISKPDGDTMQENMLNRLKDDIFQTAMVANLNDAAFSGNASGVAIRYKLLPMQNQAAVEERKFTIALRNFLGTIVSVGQIIGSIDASRVRKDLNFHFDRNIPMDIANEAQAASTLSGVVSKQTQLSTLSFVDDPKTEMQRIQDEQAEQVKQAVQNQASAVDAVKGDDDDNEHSVLEEKTPARDGLDEAKLGQRRSVQQEDR